MIRNFKMVDKIIFGRGAFNQLDDILSDVRTESDSYIVFLLDEVFNNHKLKDRIPLHENDFLMMVNTQQEPTTFYVDVLKDKVKSYSNKLPAGIIGIGGGTTMDLAKAVSLMLTNPGSSADYQGWDLIKNPAVYHAGIPTLSGTGAEVSRTSVLKGPVKKLGINSDFTVFDQIVLDPDLISEVPKEQRFHTAMDCFIHCAESLTGTYLNTFSKSLGEKSADLVREVYLSEINRNEADEKLMLASMMGGLTIAYSQVGICHALSYGLSYILNLRHGFSNCIVFDCLEEYYSDYVNEFRNMMKINDISLPKNLTSNLKEEEIEKMIDISLVLEPLWDNALGKNWKQIMTREKIRELFLRM